MPDTPSISGALRPWQLDFYKLVHPLFVITLGVGDRGLNILAYFLFATPYCLVS